MCNRKKNTFNKNTENSQFHSSFIAYLLSKYFQIFVTVINSWYLGSKADKAAQRVNKVALILVGIFYRSIIASDSNYIHVGLKAIYWKKKKQIWIWKKHWFPSKIFVLLDKIERLYMVR